MKTGVSVYTIAECAQQMGEEALNVFLQGFACPLNEEVEQFLKDKAQQSTRLSSSVTYLVWGDEYQELIGYFTLMMKAYSVESGQLSSKNRNLIQRFAEVDESGKFVAPVYLIAQLGKNFAIPKERQPTGTALLRYALGLFRGTKKVLGGKLVMVEREANRPKLQEFYNKNGFKSWTRRINEKDGVEFDQMFAVLNDEPPAGGPGS